MTKPLPKTPKVNKKATGVRILIGHLGFAPGAIVRGFEGFGDSALQSVNAALWNPLRRFLQQGQGFLLG
jgi:hypothetical protein